jgi:hypothetical protein
LSLRQPMGLAARKPTGMPGRSIPASSGLVVLARK